MSAPGDREDEIRDTLDDLGLTGAKADKAYELLVELHQLRDEVRKLGTDLHVTRRELTLSKWNNKLLADRVGGKPLYDHWTTGEAPRVTLGEGGKPSHWHVTFNEYQRRNLLWLMCDLMGYWRAAGVEPFTYANTGDWAGEIPNMLRADHNEDAGQPNQSVEHMRERVEAWKRGR